MGPAAFSDRLMSSAAANFAEERRAIIAVWTRCHASGTVSRRDADTWVGGSPGVQCRSRSSRSTVGGHSIQISHQLEMAELDLLSARDALEKACWEVDLTVEPGVTSAAPSGQPVSDSVQSAPLMASPVAADAARPSGRRAGHHRHRRLPAQGQGELFPIRHPSTMPPRLYIRNCRCRQRHPQQPGQAPPTGDAPAAPTIICTRNEPTPPTTADPPLTPAAETVSRLTINAIPTGSFAPDSPSRMVPDRPEISVHPTPRTPPGPSAPTRSRSTTPTTTRTRTSHALPRPRRRR